MQRGVHNPGVPITPLYKKPNASAADTLRFPTRSSAPHQRTLSIASALRRCMTGGRL